MLIHGALLVKLTVMSEETGEQITIGDFWWQAIQATTILDNLSQILLLSSQVLRRLSASNFARLTRSGVSSLPHVQFRFFILSDGGNDKEFFVRCVLQLDDVGIEVGYDIPFFSCGVAYCASKGTGKMSIQVFESFFFFFLEMAIYFYKLIRF